MYQKVFGDEGSASPERPFTLPLVVDGTPQGEIAVILPSAETPLRIAAEGLRMALEPIAQPPVLDKITAGPDTDGKIALPALEKLGLGATFEEADLEVHIHVPAEIRQRVSLDLRRQGPPPPRGQVVHSSPVSGHINLRSGIETVYRSPVESEKGLQPVQVSMDGAINVDDIVLEGAGFWRQDGAPAWRKGDFRLLHDWPDRLLRVSVGDQSISPESFQGTRDLAGLKIERNFSLQPYRITRPAGSRRFLLKSPSRVEIFINGRRRRTLDLPAGPYNIRNLPFVTGLNDVRLRITDDVGQVEELYFPFFFDGELLAAAEHEFSYVIGFPKNGIGWDDYEIEFPTISGFHRFGVTESLTLGGNFQADARQQMVGANALWASAFGTFFLDVGLSRIDGFGKGVRAKLEYRLTDSRASQSTNRSFAASAEYNGSDFGALGSLAPINPIRNRLAARYSQDLGWGLTGGLAGTLDLARGDSRDTYSLNANLSARLGNGVSLTISADRAKQSDGTRSFGALLTLSVSFARSRQTVITTTNTRDRSTRLDWGYAPPTAIDHLAANAVVQRRPQAYDMAVSLGALTNRLDVGMTHDLTVPREDDQRIRAASSLALGTSVAFARDQVSVGRPISNSFAMVVPHPNLEDIAIGADRVAGTYAARTDFLGPAVIPDVEPYFQRNITIDAPDLPIGYDLGQTEFSLQLSHQSGTLLQVGTDAVVLLGGTILDSDGQPVSLQAGEITSLEEPDRQPVVMFTNRGGRFRVEGLKPGRYQLQMRFDPKATVAIRIPEGARGQYDAGEIRLPVARPDEGTSQ